MKAIVFAGPTISAAEVQTVMDATVLPPAGQGDLYRAARQDPPAIGLIDGYFEGVPSVWHKEILWALEQGIAVFGSASMGALRAAELAPFGMIGVGDIFASYLSGSLCDDDEVAVLHSPKELGFAALSEPMVSIRATAARAEQEAVLDAEQSQALTRAAKQLFYHDRTWAQILAGFAGADWHPRFSAWLATGRVDAKRKDAQEMLVRMANYLNGQNEPAAKPPQKLEPSLAWRELVRRAGTEQHRPPPADLRVLDELRLEPDRYQEFRTRAAARCLALGTAERAGRQAERAAILRQLEDHREAHGLFQSRALQRWLAENRLTPAGYEALLAEAALAGSTVEELGSSLDAHMLAELRQAGAYARLQSRAAAKAHLREPGAQGQSMPPQHRLHVAAWYFEDRLQRNIPDDLAGYGKSLGLDGLEAFYDLIWHEFMYHTSGQPQPAQRNRE